MQCSAVTDACLQVISLRVAEQVGGWGIMDFEHSLASLIEHVNLGAEDGSGRGYGFKLLGYRVASMD